MTYRPWRSSSFLRGLPRAVQLRENLAGLISQGDRIYTWDSLHGEIECFNKRGYHLGVLNPETGSLIKAAVRGRRIDV